MQNTGMGRGGDLIETALWEQKVRLRKWILI